MHFNPLQCSSLIGSWHLVCFDVIDFRILQILWLVSVFNWHVLWLVSILLFDWLSVLNLLFLVNVALWLVVFLMLLFDWLAIQFALGFFFKFYFWLDGVLYFAFWLVRFFWHVLRYLFACSLLVNFQVNLVKFLVNRCNIKWLRVHFNFTFVIRNFFYI